MAMHGWMQSIAYYLSNKRYKRKVIQTNPEFAADVTKSPYVLSPVAIKANAAIFTSLKNLDHQRQKNLSKEIYIGVQISILRFDQFAVWLFCKIKTAVHVMRVAKVQFQWSKKQRSPQVNATVLKANKRVEQVEITFSRWMENTVWIWSDVSNSNIQWILWAA